MGMIGWNAALMPGTQREAMLQDLLRTAPAEVRQTAEPLLQEMIRRKELLFPRETRAILDYQLSMTPNGPHLQVLSTLDPP
jgi:hypothetical protein